MAALTMSATLALPLVTFVGASGVVGCLGDVLVGGDDGGSALLALPSVRTACGRYRHHGGVGGVASDHHVVLPMTIAALTLASALPGKKVICGSCGGKGSVAGLRGGGCSGSCSGRRC